MLITFRSRSFKWLRKTKERLRQVRHGPEENQNNILLVQAKGETDSLLKLPLHESFPRSPQFE